jgi:hypothetical protein
MKTLGAVLCLVCPMCLPIAAQLRPEAAPPADKKQPAKAARVIIETVPSAEVYLDDVFQGRASTAGRVVIANPTAGEHTLRVTLAGKKDHEERVAVAAGKDTNVQVALTDLPARITVHSSPGSEVFLDDVRRGATDTAGELVVPDAPVGSHTIRVSAAGKKEFQEQVSLQAGKEASVQARLPDLPGKIGVHSLPGAEVLLDDARRGVTDSNGDLTVQDVPPGAHTLRVTARGKRDLQESVEIAAGEKAIVQATLTDLVGKIVVHSSPGADVLLDDVRRGTTDSSGDLVVPDVAPGSHDLRVWATGKKNYQQQVILSAGQETRIDASLAPVEQPAPAAPPPVHTFRVSTKLGMLVYRSGTLTVDNQNMSFHTDDGKYSFEFSLAEIQRAFETLGDLGTRHDLHIVLKSGKQYEMINAEGAGHGTQGAQFVSQAIALVNRSVPPRAK